MKTHLFLIGAMSLLGISLLPTSYAADTSEYLHFTRHRDSNGNLLMGPTQHQAAPSVMQKTVMPSQPKTVERQSTDWGMSVQEVKKNEPVQSSWELQSPVLADLEQRVAYHTQIEGIDAALTYMFYEDHLGQAKYVFEPQHEDAAEFVNDFHTVENWIRQSYGPPTSLQEIWLDTLYQYDKSLWGQALKRGHLVMVAEWKNPGTDIVLVLNGENDEVGLVADFASTTYVVPVSLDTQGQEEPIEAMSKESAIQESYSNELTSDPSVDEVSGHHMMPENPSSGDFHPETEMASQGPTSEFGQIEPMQNKDFPVQEPENKEFPVHAPENKELPVHAPQNKEFPVHGSVEPSMESASMEKGLKEPASDLLVEDLSGHHMMPEIGGSGDFHPETEMVSQGPKSEFGEIEPMQNKDFPVQEPENKEFPVHAPLNKEFPIQGATEQKLDPHHL